MVLGQWKKILGIDTIQPPCSAKWSGLDILAEKPRRDFTIIDHHSKGWSKKGQFDESHGSF
jgi:hypothetical protein